MTRTDRRGFFVTLLAAFGWARTTGPIPADNALEKFTADLAGLRLSNLRLGEIGRETTYGKNPGVVPRPIHITTIIEENGIEIERARRTI